MNESSPGIFSTLLSSGGAGSSVSSGFLGDLDDADSLDDLGIDNDLLSSETSPSSDCRWFFDLDEAFFFDFLMSELLDVRFFFDFCCISPWIVVA